MILVWYLSVGGTGINYGGNIMEQSNVLLEEEIKEYKPMVLGIAKQYWQNYNNGKEIHIEFNDIVQDRIHWLN